MQPTNKLELPDYLEQGEYARLIPVVADTSREQRITSVVMAALMSVEEFGRAMLQMVGAPATKTSKITCMTEVVFKKLHDERQKLRPDGLIQVKAGSRVWTTIVEAKIGGAELKKEQIEDYLYLARTHKVDAVITISNQFAAIPTHHPVQINKQKVRSVDLYHWSWTSIVSEAILLAEHKGVSDPDQAYILKELIRYFKHKSSKVASFTRMGSGWKDLCTAVQQDVALSKSNQFVIDSVNDWQQLIRYISLEMSLAIGHSVSVVLSRKHKKDPNQRLQDDIAYLIANNRLEAEFDIPNAASRVKLIADIKSRTLHVSMRLKAPTDKTRATALVNWALKQVSKCEDEDLVIRAIWHGRITDTGASLGQIREDRNLILNDNPGMMPMYFDFVRIIDVAGRFRGASKFVETGVSVVPDFYKDVGQYLKAWIPPAPKVEEKAIEAVESPSLISSYPSDNSPPPAEYTSTIPQTPNSEATEPVSESDEPESY